MKKALTLVLLMLVLVSLCSYGQEKEAVAGKDDQEALGTFAWFFLAPVDFVATPVFNLWAGFWTAPARGADLLQYQDKYYYDYGTMTYRETDDRKPAGRRPLGEFKAPDHRPRGTKRIIYLPPKR